MNSEKHHLNGLIVYVLQPRLTIQTSMGREIDRYATFAGWPPTAAAWPNQLAAAGFYYTGRYDEVVCYSCGVTRSNWQPGMSPVQEHRRLKPTCSFINNQADNVPVMDALGARSQLRFISQALCDHSSSTQANQQTTQTPSHQQTSNPLAASVSPQDIYAFPSLPVLQAHLNSSPSSPHQQTSSSPHQQTSSSPHQQTSSSPHQQTSSSSHQQTSSSSTQKPNPITQNTGESNTSNIPGSLGIHTDKPLHPEMALTAKRLATFKPDWPYNGSLFTKDLAEAGFYFNGSMVTCFYCGATLENLTSGDSPWVEHARCSPHCVYLNTHQGLDFVSLVQDLSSRDSQVDYRQVREILQEKQPSVRRPIPLPSPADPEDDSDAGEVEKEHEELLQQAMCKICLDREVTIVFLPCGHLVSCAECAPALKHCPVCRAAIRGTVRAYMS